MSNIVDLDHRPNGQPAASVDAFIAASGACLSDQVIIAGAAHLEFLISLTRRGFLSVVCQSPQHGPHVPNSKADAILAPAVRDEAALLAILDGLGSELRDGGVLVVEAITPIDCSANLRLRRALHAQGLAALEPAADRGDSGALWRAHKKGGAIVRAA